MCLSVCMCAKKNQRNEKKCDGTKINLDKTTNRQMNDESMRKNTEYGT